MMAVQFVWLTSCYVYISCISPFTALRVRIVSNVFDRLENKMQRFDNKIQTWEANRGDCWEICSLQCFLSS